MNWRISSRIMPASSPQISLCLLSEHAGVTHVVTIQSLPKCLPRHNPLLKLPPFCHPLKSNVCLLVCVSNFHLCMFSFLHLGQSTVPCPATFPSSVAVEMFSTCAATWQMDSDPRACHMRAVHKLSTSLQSE